MKTIALFGGSFDPPHIGHKAIVEALIELDFIDKVVVMPTFLNPFKSHSHASSKQRLRWLKDIFNEFKNVIVDDFEVLQNKKVSTIQSVKYLLKRYEKIYVVIGADNLESLHKWDSFEKLNSLVTFIVVSRDNIKVDKDLIALHVDVPISSSSLRENMQISKLPEQCALEIEKFYKEKNEQ